MEKDNTSSQKSAELDQLTHQIGRVVAAKRASRRMSQTELAAASGVSRAAIALLESPGKGGDPKLSTLLAIARSLNTALPMLIYEAQVSAGYEVGSQQELIETTAGGPLGVNPLLLGTLGGPIGLGIGAILNALSSRPAQAPPPLQDPNATVSDRESPR